MDSTSPEPVETKVGIDPETGFATDGEWPINHRLRAEALSAAGKSSDPAGTVADDMIAEAGARVAALEADTPSADWPKAKLLDAAADAGVEVPKGATKAEIMDHIQAADTASQEG